MSSVVLRVAMPCVNCGQSILVELGEVDPDAYLFCPSCRARLYVSNDPAGIVESLAYYRAWAAEMGLTVGSLTLQTVNNVTGEVITTQTF